MGYSASPPLGTWLGPRRAALDALAAAYDTAPSTLVRGLLGDAYVVRSLTEFQGFARDLHDLAAGRLVDLAAPVGTRPALLVEAVTAGRLVDRGNPDLRTLDQDFSRLGIPHVRATLGAGPTRSAHRLFVELRNAITHADTRRLGRLRDRGVREPAGWARANIGALDRIARALDHAVWNHLVDEFGQEPW